MRVRIFLHIHEVPPPDFRGENREELIHGFSNRVSTNDHRIQYLTAMMVGTRHKARQSVGMCWRPLPNSSRVRSTRPGIQRGVQGVPVSLVRWSL